MSKKLKYIKDVEYNSLFSYTNNRFVTEKHDNIGKLWVHSCISFLNKNGYIIITREEIDKVPNPYRDLLKLERIK